LCLGAAGEAKWHVGPIQSMAKIEQLVAQDDISEAAKRLSAGYRFDNPVGLDALRQFSMLVLRRGLSEHDPYERCYAASSLGQSGEPGNIAILVAAFRSSKLGVKTAAADGLGEIGDDAAIAALQQLYNSGTTGDRETIVETLAQATNPNAVVALSEALSSSDGTVRLIAIKGLGKLGNRAAVPRLRELWATDRDSLEKTSAARSLLQLGDDSGMATIKAAIHDPRQVWAMATAALALGDAHDPQVVPILMQALTAQDDIDVKLAAAIALTHYNVPAAVEFMKRALKSGDPITVRHIGQLLGDIDFRNGREVLTAAMADEDIGLRMAVLKVISSFGGEEEVAALTRALPQTDEPTSRALIARGLGRIASPTCIKPLLAMVTEENPAVRYTAADGLGRIATRLLKENGFNNAQGKSKTP
jgi:HEAT repeat protein